uniref:Uncharacterized protein n=1 Tax=Cannabis sativa TaxID=3483 RepID=A0A803Q1T1_CANSA
MNRKKATTSTTTKAEAEVDELLKAVQEDMLLNLSLNSHLARVSPNYIDSDLDTRFRALKSRPSKSSQNTKPTPPSTATSDPPPQLPNQAPDPQPDPELQAVLGDDLSVRFAKLRASLSQSPAASISGTGGVRPNTKLESLDDEDEEEDEDDVVEKLIRWAKDAARLDPSPPSDEDEDEYDYEDFDRPRRT